MPLASPRFTALVIGVAWLVQLTSGAVPIRHIAPSRDDQFLECASRLLGKRVVRSSMSWLSAQVPCGSDPELFRAMLRESGVVISDAGAWLVVHWAKTESTALVMADRRYRWQQLRVVPFVQHHPSPVTGLPLTEQQVQDIGAAVIAQTRPVPASLGTEPTEGDRLDLELRVTMDRVRLRPDVDSVVAMIGFERTARLVYGELRDAQYVPLWDSPLMESLGGPNLSWNYRDLDGDGVREIVVYGAEQPYYRTLAAFDLNGTELTKNDECWAPDNTTYTCPLAGETIQFEPASPGRPFPLDVLAETRDWTRRYCLRGGRYVLCAR